MRDPEAFSSPAPDHTGLKHLAQWRARFYAEAARRQPPQEAANSDVFDAWYRRELDTAPAVDDESALAQLWQTLDTAASTGVRLRAIRKHYRLTQIDMAAIVAVEQGTISRWESGETDITDTHLTIYSHLCQGAALAFLRYGTASIPRHVSSLAIAPAPEAPAPLGSPTPGMRIVGRVRTGLRIEPTEGEAKLIDLAPLAVTLSNVSGPNTTLIALEVDDAPDLHPLRPGWLIIYAATASNFLASASDPQPGLIGRATAIETCLNRLCVVGLTAHADNRGNAGHVLLREVRGGSEAGRNELATLQTSEVETAEIAWASPVLALLPNNF